MLVNILSPPDFNTKMAACIRCACALGKINFLSVGKSSVSKISVANYAKKVGGNIPKRFAQHGLVS